MIDSKFKPIVLALGFLSSLCAEPAQAQTSATWTVSAPFGAAAFAREGDFNGDGKTDIASPFGSDGRMKLSTGSGFTDDTWVFDGGSTSWPASSDNVLAGDFNCDGYEDFAVIGGSMIQVKINNAFLKTFTTASWPTTDYKPDLPGEPGWGAGGWARVGDFDGDGCRDDILTPGVSGTTSHGHTYIGQMQPFTVGTAAFRFAESDLNPSAGSATWSWVGKFDLNSRDDFVSANGANAYMSFSQGVTCRPGGCANGYDVNFSTATWPVSGSWGSAGYARATRPSPSATTALSTILSPTGGTVYQKTPTSTPSFASTTSSVTNAWGSAVWTFIGDFDGDGIQDDIASANGLNVYMKLF